MSEINTIRKSAGQVTIRIISQLENDAHKAANLARLRNSIGKPLSDAGDVWPILLANIPSEFLSRNGKETKEESAVFTALQLYAMCMQGSSSVISDSSYEHSVGASLRSGRKADDSEALDRRFNALITADTYAEMTHHLRQLLKIVKSKYVMTVNFGRLANDLYNWQRGYQRSVCFRWAQDYYANINDQQENNLNKEESTND